MNIPDNIDEMPIDKEKDEEFNAWLQSITFVNPDGTLVDMTWDGIIDPNDETETE